MGCYGLSWVALVVLVVLGGGHPEIRHLNIPISHHGLQAVRNERAPWLNGQITCLKVRWLQVQSQECHCEIPKFR